MFKILISELWVVLIRKHMYVKYFTDKHKTIFLTFISLYIKKKKTQTNIFKPYFTYKNNNKTPNTKLVQYPSLGLVSIL